MLATDAGSAHSGAPAGLAELRHDWLVRVPCNRHLPAAAATAVDKKKGATFPRPKGTWFTLCDQSQTIVFVAASRWHLRPMS